MMPKQSSGSSRRSMNNFQARGALSDPQTYGMLMWQSKLQEKLLQEQNEKKEREKEEQRKARERLRREEENERQKREEESLAKQERQVQQSQAEKEKNEESQSCELEIPPQLFPGPAPYIIPSTNSYTEQRKQTSESHENVHLPNGPGLFPNISSRMRTSVSCDNFGKPPVPSSSAALLGNIVSFGQMGGAGSVRRTPSGKLMTVLRGDPEIRYHQKDTRNFDQSIRYLMDRDKVNEYKRELDQQLEEQRRWRSRLGSGQIKEITRKAFIENGSDRNRYFDSSNPHLQLVSPPHHHIPDHPNQQQQSRNGIELAPLIRKFNSLPKLNTLSSTDVTRPFVHSPRNEFFHPVQPNEVAESLSTQLKEKEWIQQRQQERERQATERHFETWDGFWGRPGAGAPIPFAQKSMGHAVSFANLHETPRTGHTFYTPNGGGGGGGGMGYNRVNLFKALHMTHQLPNRPK